MRTIYFEPVGRAHTIHRSLLAHPPSGYRFVTGVTGWDYFISPIIRINLFYFHLHRLVRHSFPIHLIKSRFERFTVRPPKDAMLTYSWGHLVLRKEPWILEMEWVQQLTDYRISEFFRHKRLIDDTLASPYCRKIICWSEFNRRHIEANLNTQRFSDKFALVPWAVPPKDFTKCFDDSHINLLFVGSANVPGEFNEKGGRILLEAFKLLRERYPNLRLCIRSDVPREIKRVCHQIPGIRLLDSILPVAEVEREFASADIFILPGHTYYTVLLEAMSYELPIITTNIHANSEFVEDGVRGLLIRPSERVQYYARNLLPDFDAPAYRDAIQQLDPAMVQELTEKLSILIDDQDLRRTMGRAGRREVEEGRFSVERRNEKLGRLLDEAVAD
jgi:glycosyltransferase involved in cell wall biosynthesis